MPRRALLVVLSFAVLGVCSSPASAATIGTPSSGIHDREVIDTAFNTSYLNATDGATSAGEVSAIDYYAQATGVIRFFITDSSKTVKYLSPEITVSQVGAHTYTPAAPVPVDQGDLIGHHTEGFGVIPLDWGGSLVLFAGGLPALGAVPAIWGGQHRTYSFGATYSPDADGDGHPDDSDNCPDIANSDQMDADNDGKGAACDTQELPRTKDDCKNAGWRTFDGTATFRNQGDCVSYVATRGENEPAGR